MLEIYDFIYHTPTGKLIYPMPVTGYLSGRPQKFRTQRFPYEPNSKFLIHSDGFVNANVRKALLGSCQSVPAIAEQLKEKQVNQFRRYDVYYWKPTLT